MKLCIQLKNILHSCGEHSMQPNNSSTQPVFDILVKLKIVYLFCQFEKMHRRGILRKTNQIDPEYLKPVFSTASKVRDAMVKNIDMQPIKTDLSPRSKIATTDKV